MRLHLTVLFGILVISGCATPVRIKVVDGLSGRPLEHVTVRWSELKYFGLVDVKTIEHPVSTTGINGLVEIHDIKTRNRSHSFGFQKEGYERAAVLVDFRDRPSFGLFSPYSTNAVRKPVWNPVSRGMNEIRVPLHPIN